MPEGGCLISDCATALNIVGMSALPIDASGILYSDSASACRDRTDTTDVMDGRSAALPAVILRLTRARLRKKSSEAPVRLGFRKALAIPDSTYAVSYRNKAEEAGKKTVSAWDGLVLGATTIGFKIKFESISLWSSSYDDHTA